MITILAQKVSGKAEFITGKDWKEVESKADSKGMVKFEDALGGVYGKIEGEWIFIYQKGQNALA